MSLSKLAQVDSTNTDYFLGDALGSTRQLVNSGDEITLAESYDPFGNPLSGAGSGGSIFGYTSEQTDVTGLQYLRARYYDPGAGRFLTRDSFAGYADLPQSHLLC